MFGPDGGQDMIDSTQAAFTRDVVDASREVPVLVDFWAPWCGPCRVLGPTLENLEREYGGRFRLVKIDSDRNPELSAQFGVRSIPYVVAFADGKPVDAFVGALPESQLRAFIDKLLPDPSEIERRKAARLLAANDPAGAASALRAAVALGPDNDDARLDLAALLMQPWPAPPDAQRLAEAQQALAGVSRKRLSDPALTALRTRLAALEQSAGLPARAELETRIAADGDDLAARRDLANRLIADGRFEPALEHLLAIVERNRAFDDDVGRRTMLAVFDLASDQPELVSRYRRRLAAALNR
jgi:putative thioredoxin